MDIQEHQEVPHYDNQVSEFQNQKKYAVKSGEKIKRA
jgi:hypothetical protein